MKSTQDKMKSLPAHAKSSFASEFSEEYDTPYILRCICMLFLQVPMVIHSMSARLLRLELQSPPTGVE